MIRSLLITGGTGTFGIACVRYLLKSGTYDRIVIYSRDELKQSKMREQFPDSRLRWFIGDVRDSARLLRAMRGVSDVIHTAALKQVVSCEYNPTEAIRTNITGSENVIAEAIACGVRRVMFISSDKAVNPINLYGATKLCAEKLFIRANAYAAGTRTSLSCVRYGNVIGSRGSIVEVIREQAANGIVRITDPEMTRFLIPQEAAVSFVLWALEQMHGGEIFVPKLQAANLHDLFERLAPGTPMQIIGRQPGEKVHELLISPDEQNVVELDECYVVEPSMPAWNYRGWVPPGKRMPERFYYSSGTRLDNGILESLTHV